MVVDPARGYRPDLSSLEQALVVLDNGSFRKAADLLGIRPSVVSRRVRALEDGIGVSLFQRQSQGARPTLAGQQILSRARVILSDIAGLVRTASLRGSGAEGQLCIGVTASIAGGTARSLLAAFIAEYPNVEIEVVEGSSSEHLAKVRALRKDIFLRVGTDAISGVDVELLWAEAVYVALPRFNPLAASVALRWDQLANAQFIVTKMEPGPEIDDFVIVHLAALGRSPLLRTRAVRREGLLALVGLGQGITLVGTAETAVAYPDVVFRPLGDEMLPFSAVWAPNNDNPALRRFLSLARARTRGLPGPTPLAGSQGVAPLQKLGPSS